MKRRLLACLLAIGLALAAMAALAEDVLYIGEMTVVNCEEWVSLREAPSTSARRLKKVPLGATVIDAAWEEGQGDFMYCCYDGVYGYILSAYLTATTTGVYGAVLDQTIGDLRVVAERSGLGEGEYLLVTCEDADGGVRWSYETSTDYTTELTLTDAFIGGWAQDPLVMVYSAQKGLVALDAFSGEVRWSLPAETGLGASISHAVRGDGTRYIGGYYGPDPVAIDGRGNVLWKSDSGGWVWLYEIALDGDGIAAHYDMMDDTYGSGWVYFDLDGNLLRRVSEQGE